MSAENPITPEIELYVKRAMEGFLPEMREVMDASVRAVVHEMRNEMSRVQADLIVDIHDLDVRLGKVEEGTKSTRYWTTVAVGIMGAVATIIAAFL